MENLDGFAYYKTPLERMIDYLPNFTRDEWHKDIIDKNDKNKQKKIDDIEKLRSVRLDKIETIGYYIEDVIKLGYHPKYVYSLTLPNTIRGEFREMHFPQKTQYFLMKHL